MHVFGQPGSDEAQYSHRSCFANLELSWAICFSIDIVITRGGKSIGSWEPSSKKFF